MFSGLVMVWPFVRQMITNIIRHSVQMELEALLSRGAMLEMYLQTITIYMPKE